LCQGRLHKSAKKRRRLKIEIPTRNTQKIEKKREPIVLGVKNCKSYRKALQTLIGSYYKKGETELEFHTKGLLDLYNKFHQEKQGCIPIEEWKGQSSFQVIKDLDKLTIIKYQRKDKHSQPKEQITKVSKEELTALIDSIKYLNKEELDSFDIAFQYCLRMDIRKTPKGKDMFSGDFKEMFYSYRTLHNKFTIMLNALEEENLIEYSAGKVKLLNKNISVQLLLN